MANKVSNWRLLEREIIDVAKEEGFRSKKDSNGDFVLTNVGVGYYDFNLSKLAQLLTDRGVTVQGAVKATP